MAKDMFKVDGTEYTFSTWFAKVLSKDLINILLTARSEKEVAKKAKELYLHRGWRDEKRISEYIGKFFRVKICSVQQGQNLHRSVTLPLCVTEKF